MNRGLVYEFQIKLRLQCYNALYFSEYVSLFFRAENCYYILFYLFYVKCEFSFFFLLHFFITYEILVASMRLKKLCVKL